MAEDQTNENAEEKPEPVEPADTAEAAEAADVGGQKGAADAGAPARQAERQDALTPKERRRRTRADKAAKVKPRPPRSAQERHDERLAERSKKAEIRRAGRVKARAKSSTTGAEVTPPREHIPGVQKQRQGVVVSDKADKTITVRIDTARRHRRYKKIVRTSRTLHAHDERNAANIGDTVIVREARPLSRTKRWRLVRVVERAK